MIPTGLARDSPAIVNGTAGLAGRGGHRRAQRRTKRIGERDMGNHAVAKEGGNATARSIDELIGNHDRSGRDMLS